MSLQPRTLGRLDDQQAWRSGMLSSLFGLGPRIELNFVLLAFVGLLVASPIGYRIVLNLGGNFYPEPAIAIALTVFAFSQPRAWRLLAREIVTTPNVALAAGLTLLAAEGLVFTDGDFIAVYADFRCIVLLLITYRLVASHSRLIRHYSINALFWIVLFSVVGHALYYTLFRGAPSIGESVKAVYPTTGLIFLAAVAQRRQSFLAQALVVSLALFIAVTSFYRANMIIAALLLVASLPTLVGRLHAPKPSLSNLVFVSAAVLAIVLLSVYFPDISGKLVAFLSADEGRYIQSIGKLNNLFDYFRTGELGGGDDVRVEYLNFIWDHLDAFLLPSGLGYRAIIGNWGPIWSSTKMNSLSANSIDGFHLYMVAHFGIILSLAFVAQPALRVARYTARISRGLNGIPQMVYVLALLISMIVSGNTFSIISSAISFGACLAYLGSRDPFEEISQ